MSTQLNKALIWLILYCSVGTTKALSYEVPTHELFNRRAALQSEVLDGYLTKRLGLPSGVETKLLSKTIIDIFAEAGAREDDGWRFLNHFHNPLKPWPVAGLDAAVPLIDGQSSLLWAQNPPGAQGWSWHDGRAYFYQGLTAQAKTERDQALANTFRAVGQVMHLIEDASVPAHVRNDAHPPVISGYHYETWAKAHQDELNTSPLQPSLDLTSVDPDEDLVPIYKFFDTDQYTGDNPAVTDSLSVGIAEYTNAHFFSDDTIFAEDLAPEDQHYFRHPSKASVDPTPWVDPLDGQQYLAEAREGGIRHVALVSWLYRYRLVYFPEITKFLPVTIKDDLVFEEQAQHLVPRAVGYAAEALDYFFRGEIGMVKAPNQPGHFVIQNNSTEPLSGTFGLYYDDKDGIRYAVAGWNLSIPARATSEPITFPPPTDPAPQEKGLYILVFHGALGAEGDAVVAASVKADTGPKLYLALILWEIPQILSNRIVYWDIADDREVDLLDIHGVSEAVKTSEYLTYRTGRFENDCAYLLDFRAGEFYCDRVRVASGVHPENIYLRGVSAPIGTFALKFLYTGVRQNYPLPSVEDFVEETASNDFAGYQIIRGDARAYVGLNTSWRAKYALHRDYVYLSGYDGTLSEEYDGDYRLGIYLAVGETLLGTLDGPILSSISTRYFCSRLYGNPRCTYERSGIYMIAMFGVATHSGFDPTETWAVSVSYQVPTTSGIPSSVLIRTDHFDFGGGIPRHVESRSLPRLEEFWLAHRGDQPFYNNDRASLISLNGIATGTVR